jgi:hypothetical protein
MPKTASDPFFATNCEPVTAARHSETVAPSDTTDLTKVTSAIYVGGAGDLSLILANDSDGGATTFKAVPAGTTLYVQCRRIMDTNTTATNLVAMWS